MQDIAYKCYQVVILLPFIAILTVFVFGTVSVLCVFFDKDKVMHPLSRIWGKSIVYASLLPVSVKGLEKLRNNQQYIYVANHSSYYDVFLLSGFLPFPKRWMMKRSLERIPFFGSGCRHAGFVFVDKENLSAVKATYHHALSTLREGVSLIIFPEGCRSDDGHLGKFSQTPVTLANEVQIPIVPITINGTFNVLPHFRRFVTWHPLGLVVHDPVMPRGASNEQIRIMSQQVYNSVHTGISPRYQ